MLVPKRIKHRKWHRLRGTFKGKAKGGYRLAYGSYGLKSLGTKELSSRQIEAARRAMTRHVKRGGKIWIRIFPHKPISAKSAEVPMGSGKGAPDRFTALVKPGTILFEMDGVEEELAREAMYLAAQKLPIKTKFVSNNDI
jgi:large subunit ribosomal protein L16